MKLFEYLKQPGAKDMRTLAADAQVSFVTVRSVARGMRMKNYDKAKSLAEQCTINGSGSMVSVDDLCKE